MRREKADLGDVLDALIRKLQMPRDLESVGVGHDAFAAIAVESLDSYFNKTNPVPLTSKEQVMGILEMVASPKSSGL